MTGDGIVVLKIGGSVSDEAAAVDAAASLAESGRPLVVVHGGGKAIAHWSERLGLEPRFLRGLRVTDETTRDVALAVLAGLVNAELTAALLRRGVAAVGLSGVDGGLLRAEREDPELGLVGRVTLVDTSLVEDLLEAGRVPVVAPAAIGPEGELLNVNADSAAGAVAASLRARALAFLTDVPGVRGADGRVVGLLDAARTQALIADGTIAGGMRPKAEACLLAAAAGCRAAIVSAREPDALERLLAGEPAGTTFAIGGAP